MNGMTKPYKAKVVIIGDMGVGKTCLLLRFTEDRFPRVPVITLGNDFKIHTQDVGGCQMQMELWDTAGQERYKSITSRFFRGCNGVILMYDVTDLHSFTGIQGWLDELAFQGLPRHRCLLVGNKTDLKEHRVVQQMQAASLAHSLDLQYIETSVKEDANVQLVFQVLAHQMLEQMRTVTPQDHRAPSIKLDSREKFHKKSKECKC